MIQPTAKVSEHVNRKRLPTNMMLQLSSAYTDPIPSNCPPPRFQNVTALLIPWPFCLRRCELQTRLLMGEYYYRGDDW